MYARRRNNQINGAHLNVAHFSNLTWKEIETVFFSRKLQNELEKHGQSAFSLASHEKEL